MLKRARTLILIRGKRKAQVQTAVFVFDVATLIVYLDMANINRGYVDRNSSTNRRYN
jgi:hypothetical protein